MSRILPVAHAVLLLAMSALSLPSVAGAAGDRSRDVEQLPMPIERTAQRVARDLAARGYEVVPGYPTLYTQEDCDRYSFPVMQNCFGNNPTSPYVAIVVQSWEDEFIDPAMVNVVGNMRPGYSATYRLDPREAIVVAAELPPPGRYMGLESWVFTTEWLTETEKWDPYWYGLVQTRAPSLFKFLFNTVPGNDSRVQSFSSVSNNINDVVIQRQSGAAFGQTRYFIITPDQHMEGVVRDSLGLAGVRDEDVFTEPIAPEAGPFGLGQRANDFITLIRYAMPDDEHAGHAWWTKLPLSILRVRERPSSTRAAVPFGPFVPEARTAANEAIYGPDLLALISGICARWGQECALPPNNDPDRLRPFLDLLVDLRQFGPLCREIGMDCLGDGQDASYFIAPGKAFEDPATGARSIYAVVGTLATETGNATYVGLSVNDLEKLKGVVNISDVALTGSAKAYSTVANWDKFFLRYFARDCAAIASLTDGQCTTVTEEMVPLRVTNEDTVTTGLFGAALRAYVRPGEKRGPDSTLQLRPWLIRLDPP